MFIQRSKTINQEEQDQLNALLQINQFHVKRVQSQLGQYIISVQWILFFRNAKRDG